MVLKFSAVGTDVEEGINWSFAYLKCSGMWGLFGSNIHFWTVYNSLNLVKTIKLFAWNFTQSSFKIHNFISNNLLGQPEDKINFLHYCRTQYLI